MNEERFDELTRTLATGRLTRWQVLKGLWAGMLLGSAGFLQPWSATFADAQTPAVKKSPVGSPSNPRKDRVRVGSCEKFNRYIQKTGVTDETGENNPHLGGVTTFECKPKPARKLFKTEVKSRNKKRVCLHTTQLLVETPFELGPTVTVAVWQPPKPLSAGCKCEKTNYDEALEEHERWHFNDINEVEANHNETWSINPPELEACEPTLEKAKIALEKKIRNRARSECKRIHAEIKRRARTFDATHVLSPMDCSFCKPGKKASQKASDSKCVSETCGPNGVSCPPEKPTCCEGVCVNLNVGVVIDGEYRHCGKCGTSCGPGSTCGLAVSRGITCPDPVDGVCSPGMCCGCGAGCNCVPPT